ncbi:rhomboid family intramembrane serine protease [Anaerosporobacter faecicola]|uniref:rhomboid family intramembrane serine protease n=1 Tax=Anaerosporobacter faecicola TaxID=2718714 RepID=UPI00143CBA29|nr:rhomboid family intramembrane serine protease [Anaerosporobacter faecicola]
MNNVLQQAFEQVGYITIQSNQVENLLYQVREEGVYIVSCVRVMHQSLEAYENKQSKMKWNFINQGYRNIRVLHLLIADDPEEAKSYVKQGIDTYWIINETTLQLIVYENQPSDFLNSKKLVEDVLEAESNRYRKPSIVSWFISIKKKMDPAKITWSLVIVNVLLFLIMDWSPDRSIYNAMINQGGISYQTFIQGHQYYRGISHMFLHGDLDHLLGNMIVLSFVGMEVEKRLGHKRYLVLYFLGGMVAALTSLGYNRLREPAILSIGASGAIFAVVGALVAIIVMDHNEYKEIGIKRLLFFIVISIGNGLQSQGIDNAAHIGGVIAGALLGYLLFHLKLKKHTEE